MSASPWTKKPGKGFIFDICSWMKISLNILLENINVVQNLKSKITQHRSYHITECTLVIGCPCLMFCKFCHWVCLWTIGVVGKRRSKKGKSGGRISAFTAPLGSAESGQKKIWPTWQQGHHHQWNMYFPSWWTTAYKQIWLNIQNFWNLLKRIHITHI